MARRVSISVPVVVLAVLLGVSLAVNGLLAGWRLADAETEAPAPEADRVVGIDWQCTLRRNSDGELFNMRGEARCAAAARGAEEQDANVFMMEHVKVLTVRTANGNAYTVAVDGDDYVMVGAAWPP